MSREESIRKLRDAEVELAQIEVERLELHSERTKTQDAFPRTDHESRNAASARFDARLNDLHVRAARARLRKKVAESGLSEANAVRVGVPGADGLPDHERNWLIARKICEDPERWEDAQEVLATRKSLLRLIQRSIVSMNEAAR